MHACMIYCCSYLIMLVDTSNDGTQVASSLEYPFHRSKYSSYAPYIHAYITQGIT